MSERGPTCPGCGEEEPPVNDATELCRECEIEDMLDTACCSYCGQFILNETAKEWSDRAGKSCHEEACPIFCALCGSKGCLVCGPRVDAATSPEAKVWRAFGAEGLHAYRYGARKRDLSLCGRFPREAAEAGATIEPTRRVCCAPCWAVP